MASAVADHSGLHAYRAKGDRSVMVVDELNYLLRINSMSGSY